ncbi:MAG: formimidoylglutamase [Flavobacteriales bacterium]|nr:formimidoylglutamase [Flavobacteriales bacterium]
MDGILDFFQPANISIEQSEDGVRRLADSALIHTQDFMPVPEDQRIAIFGVMDDRGAHNNEGCSDGPDVIREYLYRLHDIDEPMGIIDLGNIHPGERLEDTYAAVRVVCHDLLRENIIPVILGGSQDLTYANYAAYESMEQTVNLVTVDSRLDFGGNPEQPDSWNYLNKIVLHQPNYLFNYSNIANQRYLIDKDLIELMEKMYFDLHRLGEVNGQITHAEPVIRNADIMSFDMSAIRAGDSPGHQLAGPNGLYAELACQICRYAGMADKLTSFGIYEYNPRYDERGISGHLAAQMVWHFIEGISHRRGDFPVGTKDDYIKYIVPLADHELIFYKSPLTDRWWMDVPYPSKSGNRYQRHHLVPCTYEDYQEATNEEMPDRWWKTFQKLT